MEFICECGDKVLPESASSVGKIRACRKCRDHTLLNGDTIVPHPKNHTFKKEDIVVTSGLVNTGAMEEFAWVEFERIPGRISWEGLRNRVQGAMDHSGFDRFLITYETLMDEYRILVGMGNVPSIPSNITRKKEIEDARRGYVDPDDLG